RSPLPPHRPSSPPALPPDAAVRGGSRRCESARSVPEEELVAQGYRAAGCCPQGQLRTTVCCDGTVPSSREHDGHADRVDHTNRSGVRGGQDGRLREHPAVEKTSQGRRKSENHTTTGSRDEIHID